ncbi:hypothetical protein LCGC14_0677000 [marine sediment metagenome]|uniref:Uncharacterized protein n=1 Tax=marine sediment metagenome TaxID=412755 RepID=A0A0F9TAN1_9ZZZZ
MTITINPWECNFCDKTIVEGIGETFSHDMISSKPTTYHLRCRAICERRLWH